MAKRRGKKGGTQASRPVALRSTPEKIKLVMKNLVIFLIFSILSFIFYKVTASGFLNDLFFLLLLVFGFVALSFFIVWLVLMLMKSMGK